MELHDYGVLYSTPKPGAVLLMWLDEILHGHPDRFKNQLGMSQAVFRGLCCVLQLECDLTDGKFIAADEQVAMFLYFAHRGCSVRDIMERFQHSGGTVSKCVLFPAHLLSGLTAIIIDISIAF
jgi:hypothetical protein